jgi:hypothetical protein
MCGWNYYAAVSRLVASGLTLRLRGMTLLMPVLSHNDISFARTAVSLTFISEASQRFVFECKNFTLL